MASDKSPLYASNTSLNNSLDGSEAGYLRRKTKKIKGNNNPPLRKYHKGWDKLEKQKPDLSLMTPAL